jgi:hypothetical protein
MIIVRLTGGLGNQLFQYAAARRLSIWHNTPLKLDIQRPRSMRSYALGPFRTIQSCVDSADMALHRTRVFGERILRPYDPNFLNTPPHVCLDGYWQSEKYFSGIESMIRQEFTIDREPEAKNREIAAQIAAAPSVSLHIRRGDYVSNPLYHSIHGTCTIEYYHRALRMLGENGCNALRAFIFSDEPHWVAKNLQVSCPATIVSHNGPEKAYDDLRLMSMCTHHIIANSTFSWWGAWLSTSPGKVVIAQRRWFRVNYDTRDLIPSTWFTI